MLFTTAHRSDNGIDMETLETQCKFPEGDAAEFFANWIYALRA
jgi:hypothetical protein